MAENKTEEEILETDTVNEEASSAEEETKEAGNEASAGETEAKEAEEKADKKAEKKEKKVKKKKDKKDEQIEELQDRVRRQMAEFDNFRKRTEKEKAQMFEVGAKSIIEKILPEEAGSAFADGMNMIYKQLMNELEQAGVAPIEAVGEEFDPEYHNAVMQVENDELESGTVAQELQKGYTYRDSVVRHSMVAVVQ